MRGVFTRKDETKDKLGKCENCHHSFKDSYNLKRHIERRSCYPRYKCEKCRKKFSSDADLSIHTDESKCFQCNQCNLVSASYGALIQHKQRHKEIKKAQLFWMWKILSHIKWLDGSCESPLKRKTLLLQGMQSKIFLHKQHESSRSKAHWPKIYRVSRMW